jgi:hypothetical protein
MKNSILLFLMLVSFATFSVSCKKESNDLTTKITGVYIGGFGSNVHGDLTNYEITVTKVSDKKVSIKPKVGTEFAEFETEIEDYSGGQIGSPPVPAGQLAETVVIFSSNSIPQTLAITRNLTDDQYVFVGEKK